MPSQRGQEWLDGTQALWVRVGQGLAATTKLKFCMADLVPLNAWTTPLKVPAVVGVPERTPAGERISPGGRVPLRRE